MTPNQYVDLPVKRSEARVSYRVIASVFPAIDLYADIESEEDRWNDLYELEAITNDRVRVEQNQLNLIPETEQVLGEGASFIMAPFCHLNPAGTRFSDGTFGVYYCAQHEETAAKEVAYHRTLFMQATREPQQTLVMRVIRATLKGNYCDVFSETWPWLRTDEYDACQAFASVIRNRIDFLRYESVRHPLHAAYAVFRPKALKDAKHWRYLEMYWDGKSISHISRVQQDGRPVIG